MVPTWVADMLYRASLKGMYVFKFGGIVQPPLTDDSGSILAAQDKPFSEALFHLHHIIPNRVVKDHFLEDLDQRSR